MAIVQEEKFEHLRVAPGASGFEERGSAGVLLFSDIYPGATVFATVDRPSELLGVVNGQGGGELSDGGAAVGATQPYKFERAQMPATFIAGGATFARPISLQRALVTDGKGALTPNQEIPAFADFAVAQTGALVQKGRKEHSFVMPSGAPAGNLQFKDRHILRMRWTGTAVVAEVQASPPLNPNIPNGATRKFTGQLGGVVGIVNVAPGSVTFTATVGGSPLTIRDDGRGRLVGIRRDGSNVVVASAAGLIDYLNGAYELTFGPPAPLAVPDAATSITASYEHNCRYKPLDLHLVFDSLLQ